MSTKNFKTTKELEKRNLAEAKAILGQIFFTEKYVIEDLERNTDLMPLNKNIPRIGFRVRCNEDLYKYDYANEFTIRHSRPSGKDTEYDKIVIHHLGNFLFYAFESPDEGHMEKWFLGDLNAFRRYVYDMFLWSIEADFDPWEGKLFKNHDKGESTLLALKKVEVPGFVVVDSDDWEVTKYGWRPKQKVC